ncbi:Mitochodrial transcription termination factor [Trema orientale]|uniref:Mitochodrial transcription termination factor n=1 Tax=Trema orientale TaxID=63057 RepID=A0A2P5FFP5_TREOI|nr:Mitochodrial transcription termination factor [Trema orientale]
MFGILSRRLKISIPGNGVTGSNSAFDLGSLAFSFSSFVGKSEKGHSFTVSYLVNSCGLSPDAAIVASQKVNFQNPERADSVLAFLREHEFSETQITSFVRKRPWLLLSDPKRKILPKLEFFYSKGFSKKDLVRIMSSDPHLLYRSLDNHIIPTYNLLRSVLPSNEMVITALRHQWVSLEKNSKHVISNIGLLRQLGFSDSQVASTLQFFSEILVLKPERFSRVVDKVKDMGFKPEKFTFLFAMRALAMKRFKETWNKSYKVYRRWGWSEDDILGAFRVHPNCMVISEKKIEKSMDFLVNKMGWQSGKIAKCPVILFYSFEKRIVPRCSVVQVLLSKGLMRKEDVKLIFILQCVDKIFLEKYVTKYHEQVPLLLSVYEGKVHVEDA